VLVRRDRDAAPTLTFEPVAENSGQNFDTKLSCYWTTGRRAGRGQRASQRRMKSTAPEAPGIALASTPCDYQEPLLS
jgi:hypothetical protein